MVGVSATSEGTGLSRAAATARSGARLSQEQLKQIQALAKTDRSVRSHEQAHLAAAGPYSKGGPTFTFSTGPDGQLYAVGGEVALDVSADTSDPARTIEKARVIQAAANAPVDPSTQDRAVAAMAAQMEATARQELAARQREIIDAAYRQPAANPPGSLLSLVF